MFSCRMEGLLSALLFLSVVLNSSQQKQLDLKLTSAPPERGRPKSVMLECSTTDKNNFNQGVFWFQQPLTVEPPKFIVHLLIRPKHGDHIDSKRFIPNNSNLMCRLEIKDFHEGDQGTYYCFIIINSMLHFSNGVRLAYPTVTTPAPSSTPAIPLSTESHGFQTPSHEAGVNAVVDATLDFSCSLYIWVPLAAVALLLFIAFLVTLSFLCKFIIIRRQCKHHTKKRLVKGNNGKPNRPV